MRVVLVTGLSGAGRSVALRALEDLGFEAIDNIPLAFLPALVTNRGNPRHLAVGADIRNRDFSPEQFLRVIDPLRRNRKVSLTVVFLDCDDEVLRRRFSETRRPHPLAQDRPVLDGIRHERSLVEKLRDHADIVIDTSDFEPGELRRVLTGHFSVEGRQLSLTLCSFSYKRGLPREADVVLDARFLRNPHYDDALRPLTGLDSEVGKYIEWDRDFSAFFDRITALLLPLLPRYLEEGKSYLTIAIGCTGGRHRSVFLVQKLAGFLAEYGYNVGVRHRDLEGKDA